MGTNRGRTVEPWHLMRSVILLMLVVLALALGLVSLEKRGSPVPLVLFNILAAMSIGLVMGLGSRGLFRRRPWPIKALVSAALSIVGLAFLGGITSSQSGIGPLRADFVAMELPTPLEITLPVPTLPHKTETDLTDAAYMLIAISISWMALRAWTTNGRGGGARRSTQAGASAMSVATPVPRSAIRAAALPIAPMRASEHVRSRPMVRPRRPAPGIARPANRRSGGSGARRRSLFRSRPAVQIAAYEEHRCPYCLQDINRDDVHGSVECPICHTLHHRDCWDITGTCQVPHLNG